LSKEQASHVQSTSPSVRRRHREPRREDAEARPEELHLLRLAAAGAGRQRDTPGAITSAAPSRATRSTARLHCGAVMRATLRLLERIVVIRLASREFTSSGRHAPTATFIPGLCGDGAATKRRLYQRPS
jgi:hypothetical protein